jgi:hypothetical protein
VGEESYIGWLERMAAENEVNAARVDELRAELSAAADDAAKTSELYRGAMQVLQEDLDAVTAERDALRAALADTADNEDALARVLCDTRVYTQPGAWMAWRLDACRTLDHLRAMAIGATPTDPPRDAPKEEM